MDFFKQLFSIKQVKGDKYYQKLLSPKSEPYPAKLCLSVFLNIFGAIQRELLFLDIKMTISERITKILRNLFFKTCLKGENPEENLDLFKQIFLIKPVKGDKY